MTGATWQRQFIVSHPLYRHDSVVPAAVVHDLLARIHRVATGVEAAPDLVGASAPPPLVVDDGDLVGGSAAKGASAPAAAGAGAAGSGGGGSAAPRTRRIGPAVALAPGVRMRGRSFAEEVRTTASQHTVIKALIERYAVSSGRSFADVPAFLGGGDDDDVDGADAGAGVGRGGGGGGVGGVA